MSRIPLLAGAAAPCLLLAMPAGAQAQDASSVTSDAATAPSWTGDIIVTGARETYTAPETSAATRTDTPLIQVPQSVQVVTKTLIQEQDRRTLGDALVNVSGVTPPAFIAGAADDEYQSNDPVLLYTAWRKAGAAVELHLYERGGHGFDLYRQGTTSDQWFDHLLSWMTSRNLVTPERTSAQ
ncbi:TonB-dependent receptor plug domain-containing protein [uncultured Sphingomonas sp.]|uniref:alpha/beta hydrolase n=1 Tax=uncultured Sphingomonas sp. TaxID=158754 RepID=UPI0025DF8938|nr:TonB-dependent receptor plug domain-containing protein [uncultured Sphingomonas sp.]